jgi:phosphate:Na+ symporter
MIALIFILKLAGAAMLLLYAVRMVRTGIERAMGPSFQRMITERQNSRIQAATAGAVLAIVLQSATAAALLASGFAASGLVSFAGGLSIVLGADFGSALVIQILSFKLDWLIPVLLAMGGWLFVKCEGRTPHLTGRILLGIAFILLSLRLIGEATIPIRESAFLPAIASYLESDYLTAFMVGAVITFVMHSSVAAILMFVTFVSLGVLPLAAGVSLVLGANLGSASLPIWLSRGMEQPARRIPIGNLVLRGTGAVLALLLVNLTPVMSLLDGFGDGQNLVNVHLIFNGVLLVLALPLVGFLQKPMETVLPDERPGGAAPEQFQPVSALDESVFDQPRRALGSVTREVLRMSQIVEVMARPVMELYKSGDEERIDAVRALDKDVNKVFDDIRRYVARLSRNKLSKADARRARELTEYSFNLEAAGDIISKRLLPLASEKNATNLRFSEQGWEELLRMHERVISNMSLAFNVLLSEDIESARLLLEEKSEMAHAERKSRKKHLKRLREGAEISFESSDIHLETLRYLKDLNSQISAVCYPILYRHGQLLETRLVETMEQDKASAK